MLLDVFYINVQCFVARASSVVSRALHADRVGEKSAVNAGFFQCFWQKTALRQLQLCTIATGAGGLGPVCTATLMK